jgi:hypothetical protein
MQKILFKINLKKLEKAELYVGQQGTYLDGILIRNKGESKYGDDGFIVQSIKKERRDKGERGPIVGNWRFLAGDNDNNQPEAGVESDPF